MAPAVFKCAFGISCVELPDSAIRKLLLSVSFRLIAKLFLHISRILLYAGNRSRRLQNLFIIMKY
jgi:hypothetical protein